MRTLGCLRFVGGHVYPQSTLLKLTAGKRREHSVPHTCVTINDVLEDVYGWGWATIPHLLSAGAILRFRPDMIVTIALDPSDVADGWAALDMDGGWVSTATTYYSYDDCGSCVYTEETYTPALPAAGFRNFPVRRQMVA